MAYNHALTDRVRQALSAAPNIVEKRMFGSVGFMVNGKLCLAVGDHADYQVMVRVGPTAYDDAITRPGARPAMMRGRPMTGYIFLREDGVSTPHDLASWVDLALRFNAELTAPESSAKIRSA